MSGREEITAALDSVCEGDANATERLISLLYDELRVMAGRLLDQEGAAQSLQTTALVHEAYARLVGAESADREWDGRRHFMGAAARAMRRILVDRARERAALKRGGDRRRVELDDASALAPDQLVALDDALSELQARDTRMAEIVNLRFFAGFTIDETAATLEISATTVKRDWDYARAWLFREIGAG